MPLAIGNLLHERYEVVRAIKSGGMGAVYEARDRTLANTPCAVKEILEEALSGPDAAYVRDKFKAEVAALASLQHSGIPRVRDYFAEGSALYIVMDLVQGKPLDEELSECLETTGRPLEPEVVAADALQILDIIGYLHDQGLLHRDVKPSNLIREESSGRIKLVDFGLARSYGNQDLMTMVGTPGYCSQEQMVGRAEPRSDLYSVGVTMHNLLTGVAPKILSLRSLREKMPDYRPGLATIVDRATRRRADERYANAREMQQALREWLLAPTSEASAPTLPPDTVTFPVTSPPPPPPSSTPAWLVGGVLAALGLAVGLALGRGGSTPPPAATPSPVPTVAVQPMEVQLSPEPTPVPVHQADYDLRAPQKPTPPPHPKQPPHLKTVAVVQPRLDATPSYPRANPLQRTPTHLPTLAPEPPAQPQQPEPPRGRPEPLDPQRYLHLPHPPGAQLQADAFGLRLTTSNPRSVLRVRALRVPRAMSQLQGDQERFMFTRLLRKEGLTPGEFQSSGDRASMTATGPGRVALLVRRARADGPDHCVVSETLAVSEEPRGLSLANEVRPR